MSDPTWQEAITPVTQQGYVDQNLAALETAGSPLNGWSPDAPQRALVEGESAAEAAESLIVSNLAKTASPTTCADAGDSWVDAVMGWFDIVREPAVEAVWDLTMAVAVAAAPITINAGNAGNIQAMSENGTIFLCTQASPVTLNSASGYLATVRFTAREAGVVGNVTTGTITKLISGPSGLGIFPIGEGGVQTLIAAGADQETSTEFIRRGLGRWGVIFGNPNGTAGWTRTSFDFLIPHYGHDDTADPPLTVNRWGVDDDNPLGPGSVLVTIANPSGSATTDEVTAVQDGLTSLDVKPVGSGLLVVQAASPHNVVLTATIQVDGSVPQLTIKAAAEAALARLAERFPIGVSKLVPDLVRTILMGAPLQEAAIETGVTSQTIQLDLDGFASVEEILSCSLSTFEIIASSEVLVIAPTVTVVG